MAEEEKCDVCQKVALQKCGGCHNAHYCCKEHQKLGWKTHKKICKPVKICEDENLGRYLVATRLIKPGEIVLKEMPLIWGPSQITIPVCLGCGKAIDEHTSKPCQKCGWPVCSEICQNSPSHIPECSYTMKRGDKISIKHFNIPHPNYQSITVLRCLYQKQFLPDTWDKIKGLESHSDSRKLSQTFQNDKSKIADFIRKFFKLENFSEQEILEVCGILNINGHEVPLYNPPHVALYEMTSMLEHSCSANCCKSFMSNGGILISAGVTIQKGEHISICYTDPLWGTPNRRHHLYETKFFWCTCRRCSDPTESGTYFSALKCQNTECKSFLLPKTFIETSDTSMKSQWHCDVCNASMSSAEIYDLLEKIGKKLQSMPKGKSSACKAFLKDYEHILPQNHFYMTDVKFALSQLIGQENQCDLSSVSDSDLLLKTKVIREVLEIVRILIPAEKRIMGILLFELQAAVAETGRRRAESGVSDTGDLRSTLLESKQLLLEVVELLKYEPREMPEGRIYTQAILNMDEINAILRTIHKVKGDSLM